jgi:hypothetical protein
MISAPATAASLTTRSSPPWLDATVATPQTIARISDAEPTAKTAPRASAEVPGKYTITVDRRWIQDVFPCDTSPCRFNPKTGGGGEFLSDWTPGAKTFTVRGEVRIRIFHDTDRVGGSWCYRDGPDAKYSWSVAARCCTRT